MNATPAATWLDVESPVELSNSSDIRILTGASGAPEHFEVGPHALLQYPASPVVDGAAGLWLRRRSEQGVDLIPLFGQLSPLRRLEGPIADCTGSDRRGVRTGDLEIVSELRLSDRQPAWYWHVQVLNDGDTTVELDLVHAHDVALAAPGAVRNNEHYVSQYLDVSPVQVPGHGVALGVRQNMPGPTPWVIIGSLGEAVGWASDLVQLTGTGRPEGEPWSGLRADLPSRRRQGEHTVAALQTARVSVAPGQQHRTGFFGRYLVDHPDATGPADRAHAEAALADPAAQPPERDSAERADAGTSGVRGRGDHRSWLGSARRMPTREATDGDLDTWTGPDRAHPEYADDVLLGYFTAAGDHLVTAAKQARVLRPHGHLMRSGTDLAPDDRGITATTWMDGSFCSHLTHGHVTLGQLMSVRRSYLGLNPGHGLRLLVRTPGEDRWWLLGTPSAWLVGLDHCIWWYAPEPDADPSGPRATVEVRTDLPAAGDTVTITIGSSRPLEFLAAAHVTWNAPEQPLGALDIGTDRAVVRPADQSLLGAAADDDPRLIIGWTGADVGVDADGPLFRDGRSRRQPWVTLTAQPTECWQLTLTPKLVEGPEPASAPPEADLWSSIREAVTMAAPDTAAGAEVDAIATALPWFAHDALIHFLSPRGLEQYSGGGWGTRDISQGPVGLLLTLGAHTELRAVLVLIMSAQNARGDWPQAFQFLARHRTAGQGDAHGDVVYWPLTVLAQYLAATGDTGILDERVTYTGDEGPTEPAPVLDHLRAAVDHIEATLIAGSALPAYGHGDWNDSLQPADPELARRLTSTWTAILQSQTLGELAQQLEPAAEGGRVTELATRMQRLAETGSADLRRLLLVDGVLTGYGYFDRPDSTPEPMIHPADRRTGLRYSLLPMIHAITAELLTPAEAERHLRLITDHLSGADGVRLFDQPIRYQGGPMSVFQRAEASTFFGREIGLMYVHAHLRYAEALAQVGDGPGLLRALAKVQPIGITDRVPGARPRQSTCYYSSSDAAFADRAAADEHYDDVRSGTVGFEGGWRVYSSGPGLYLWILVSRMLGIRVNRDRVEIDPVLDPDLDGLEVEVPVAGRRCRFRFALGATGHGVTAVTVGDGELTGRRLSNRYRAAGISVEATALPSTSEGGLIEVTTR